MNEIIKKLAEGACPGEVRLMQAPRRAGKSMMLGSIQVDLVNTELDTAKDYFGQPLKVGDYVAAAWTAKDEPTLAIYEIKRFSYVLYRSDNKTKRLVMLELLRLGSKTSATAERKADNVIKIDPALLTFKTLKS